MIRRNLLENLLKWFAQSHPPEPKKSDGWERGELQKLNREFWLIRAARLDKAINRFNLENSLDLWLPNTSGNFPCGRVRVLAVPFATVSSDQHSPAERLFYARTFSDLTGDAQANIEHDRSRVFARNREGSLRLEKDSRGVWLTALLIGEHGRTALRKIRSGEICGASIEHPADCKYFVADSIRRVVHVLQTEIAGVALVQHPAFSQTIGTIHLQEKKND